MKYVINGTTYTASQDNPYGNEWTATDENYSASTDDEGIWHADAPMGEGDTANDAIQDLLGKQYDYELITDFDDNSTGFKITFEGDVVEPDDVYFATEYEANNAAQKRIEVIIDELVGQLP
mgnify:CR=1 FL=1